MRHKTLSFLWITSLISAMLWNARITLLLHSLIHLWRYNLHPVVTETDDDDDDNTIQVVLPCCCMMQYVDIFLSLYSLCLFSNWNVFTNGKHWGVPRVTSCCLQCYCLCTTECMNVAFYTILLNRCLHWSCALQLFLHFYQVSSVRCKNKFGMQHRLEGEFGFVLLLCCSSRFVLHYCPLQPEQGTAAAF